MHGAASREAHPAGRVNAVNAGCILAHALKSMGPMRTLLLALLALLCNAASAETARWMAPTPFTHEGQPVALEVVIDTPAGVGPFPVLVFNHGSTGLGNDPGLFRRTYLNAGVSAFFNARGWAVAYPQRRGRGASGGLYDEGFQVDRSRYTCEPEPSLRGLDRAIEDLDALMAVLEQRKELDTTRMLIGGQSRGGLLAVAYAGRRPERFLGVINFVGGWMTDRCPRPEDINHVALRRGAGYPRPMLWLYGENDPFYSIPHTRAGFESFRGAGGQGAYHVFRIGFGSNGHQLVNHPQLWGAQVDEYLATLR